MHRLHRFASTARFLLVASLLLFLAFGLGGLTDADATDPGNASAAGKELVDERPSTPEPERVRELTQKRTAKSKTYELADGRLEWVGYGEVSTTKMQAGPGRKSTIAWSSTSNG
jgi:hypothetical protein